MTNEEIWRALALWPQAVIAVTFAYCVIYSVTVAARKADVEDLWATVAVFAVLTWVLHMGGFW